MEVLTRRWVAPEHRVGGVIDGGPFATGQLISTGTMELVD
jgi:hypothetical protein